MSGDWDINGVLDLIDDTKVEALVATECTKSEIALWLTDITRDEISNKVTLLSWAVA